MKKCKRIEIVIEETLAHRFEDLMHKIDASYTLVSGVSGLGERGHRRADELTGASSNCLAIVASDNEELTQQIVDGVRPLLAKSGGICLVTDALWVVH